MPLVSDGTSWGLPETDAIRLAKLRPSPIAGVIPSGVTVGAFSGTAQAFSVLSTYLWNDDLAFNKQGQRWVGVSGTTSDGCRNEATPRTSSGSRYNHIIETEILYSGQGLDIAFIGSSYYEVMVYVERDGRMYRAMSAPVSGTTTGLRHLPITFSAYYQGRVRIVLAGALFVGIKCEASAIVKRAPDRIFYICDGSEIEPAGFKQASGTSYLCMGLTQWIFELLGIVGVAMNQPQTGFFRNNGATVTSDTATANNETRFFSQSRKDWAAPHFAGKPLFYLVLGSRADGGNSGATGASNGPMAVRAKACYDWIRSMDPRCNIVQASVLPQGSGIGHDLNLAEQSFAIAATYRGYVIDGLSWFNATQKVPLIGADGVNTNDLGTQFWASKISEAVLQMSFDSLRLRRIK